MYKIIDTPSCEVLLDQKFDSPDFTLAVIAGVKANYLGSNIVEFSSTVTKIESKANVIYIRDKERTWFNNCYNTVVDVLNSISSDNLKFLGMSMGGFGSLLFGQSISSTKTILAYGPQFSIKPDIIPEEKRWIEHSSKVKQWHVPHCMIKNAYNPVKIILVGGTCPEDIRHIELLLEHGMENSHIFILDQAHHNVASYLKSHEALIATTQTCLSNDYGPDQLESLFRLKQIPSTRIL